MQEYSDDDLERRLDRAIEAAADAAPTEALRLLTEVRSELEEEIERTPGSASSLDDLGRCLGASAEAHARAGEIDRALAVTEEALATYHRAEDVDPLAEPRTTYLSAVRLRRSVFLTQKGDLDAALAEAKTATAAIEREIAADTARERAQIRFIGADAHRHLAWLYPRMGHPELELEQRERALSLGREGIEIEPGQAATRAHAGALREISRPRAMSGDLDGALDALREARRRLTKLGEESPTDTRWPREVALTRSYTGRLLRDAGRFDDARHELESAAFIAENLLALDPGDVATQGAWVQTLEERGDLEFVAGAHDAARDIYARRLAEVRRLLPDDAFLLGRALLDTARIPMAQGRPQDAVETLVEATDVLSRTPEEELGARDALADAYDWLADAYRNAGAGEKQLDALRRRADVRRAIHRRVPAHEHAGAALVKALGDLGDAAREAGELDDAAAAHREELELARTRAAREEAPEEATSELAIAAASLAMTLEPMGELEEALEHARVAVDARRRLEAERGDNAAGWLARVVCWDLRRVGRLLDLTDAEEDAAAYVEDALARMPAPDDVPEDERSAWLRVEGACRDTLAALHENADELEDALAERDRERAVALELADEHGFDDARWTAARASADAAAIAAQLGRTDDALARLDDAVEARERCLADAADPGRDARRELSFALWARAWERRKAGLLPDALDDAERSLALDRDVLAESPDDRLLLGAVAESLEAVAWLAQAVDDHERMEEAAREEVAIRRRLADGGDDADNRSLGWALYAHCSALRDLERALDALPVATAGLDHAETLLTDDPDDPNVLGLLANVAEVRADVAPRDDPAEVDHARALYQRCIDIHERFTPDELGHDDTCTCLEDCRRKIADLDGD